MANAPKHAAPTTARHAAPIATETDEFLAIQAPDPTPDDENPIFKEEKPAKKQRLWIFPTALAGLLSAAYIGGSVYFMDHFLPNTTVESDDVSLQQPEELALLIDARAGEYSGTFVGDGFEIPFSAADIDYAYDGAAYAQDALSQQNPWSWPLEFANTHQLSATPVATFDASKAWTLFEPVVAEGKQVQDSLPNHGVRFDEESDHYIVAPEAMNAMLDRDAIVAKAQEGMSAEADAVEIGPDCYTIDPQTQAIIDAANHYADAKVHLTMNGVDALDIDGKQISQWLTLNDDGTVTLDEQAILDWGPGGLSDILDTVGKPRTYTRPDGEEITVPGGGPYGWSIKGAESSKLILEAIKSGEPQTIDIPTYSNAAKVDPGGQDWPDKYIDVDISEQHARMYDDGKLVWETDVVTGQNDGVHDTPRGVFYITEHETDVRLFNAGTIEEGKEYENGYNPVDGWESHVDFWMAYDGGERGFHNADWRWEFGGDIYTWWGSHGCINMDYDPARELYDLTELGDAVVIHD